MLSFGQDRLESVALLSVPSALRLLSLFHRRHDVAAPDETCGVLGLYLGHCHHFGGAPLDVLTSDRVELVYLIFGQLQALAQAHDRLYAALLPTLRASHLRAASGLLGREVCHPGREKRRED